MIQNKNIMESRLLSTCVLVEAPADQKLIEEGQDAEAFYFMYHGRAVAYQNGCMATEQDSIKEGIESGDGDHIHLGVLGPGTNFGEISILTDTPCRASIVTVTRCLLLRVLKHEFRDKWCTIPQFRAEFMIRIFGKACRLEHILCHAVTKEAFCSFLISEHAFENMEFVDAVHDFHKCHNNRSGEENITAGYEIIKDFIEEQAEKQVNVPQVMVSLCLSRIGALSSKIDPSKRSVPIDLFDNLKDEILGILEMGTFSRFKKSAGFSSLLVKMRAYEQMDLSNISGSHGEENGKVRRSSFAPSPTHAQQKGIIMTTL
jgi:hypothetical protein